MRLRGICEEAIGAMSNRVEIQVASPKTAADQMLRRLDRDFLRQLINLLRWLHEPLKKAASGEGALRALSAPRGQVRAPEQGQRAAGQETQDLAEEGRQARVGRPSPLHR